MDESPRTNGVHDLREHSALERLARMYAARNQISRTIARVPSRDELFHRICRILVDVAQFRMAWVGWHDAASHQLVIEARCGLGSEELLTGPIRVDASGPVGPTVKAFRAGHPSISNDLLNDPDTVAVRDEIVRRGLRSGAAFPIIVRKQVCATLSIYSGVAGHFQGEETALLLETAGDIAFALENLAREHERHNADVRIRRLNRTYAMLSAVNKAIVHERTPEAVLQAVCEVAVSVGGFRMAWVGIADADGRRVTPTAQAGAVDGYLDALSIDRTDPARNTGPAARALDIARHVICGDIANDAGMAPWRDQALERGYRSLAAFPLVKSGEVVGAFVLYSSDPYFFDDEEVRLLDELAMDIGFALSIHERDVERRRIEGRLRQSEGDLRESIAELRAVTMRLYEIKEEERARIARDLHDHLGQALTALKMDVAEVGRRLNTGTLAPVRERLTEMSSLIDDAVQDMRRLAAALRPATVDELGLLGAIRLYLQDVERRGGPVCVLTTPLADVPIRKELALVSFRILQEAMTNVLRHSGATRVTVTVDVDDAATLHLVIRDNGRGLPPAAERRAGTLGLAGMRDRARLVDGEVIISGAPGAGTTVTARIPLEAAP